MLKHLSIRIAWHENKWNGTVCSHPAQNTYCIHLPRILAEKDNHLEVQNAGKPWNTIHDTFLPPCKAEGGSFMNTISYKRTFNHPYKNSYNNNSPHSVLKPTTFNIPPFSSFAVPFWWMLKSNQKELKELYPDLPYDKNPPFNSSWLYTSEAQNAILKKFFDPVKEDYSLAIYYVKGANPIDEDLRRLIAGIGVIKKKFQTFEYNSTGSHTFPIWDRLITHGINPKQAHSEGVLIPYQEYLNLPDDFVLRLKNGNKTKQELLNEIKVTLQDTGSRQEIIEEFAYGSSWVNDSTMIILLSKLRAVVERIRDHGIVEGYWTENLIWIDRQIGKVKENMGPFPSFANALIALGFQYAHSLEADLRTENKLGVKDDPWDIWEDLIFGNITIFGKPYSRDFVHFKEIWITKTQERIKLLQLLSRFELSDKQIKNWFDPICRKKIGISATNQEILENPYIIAEEDQGDSEHYPIAVETIDSGLFEDAFIQGDNIPSKPQLVESPLDKRRIRALISSILKVAATNGDTLVSVDEITEHLNLLNLQRTTVVPTNYIKSSLDFIENKIAYYNTSDIAALQLKIYADIESYLRKIFVARSKRQLNPLTEDWANLIKEVIKKNGITFNNNNHRHLAALDDQIAALQQVTGRKLSVLHGPAGTGKTTVLGALFGSKELIQEGILLLAPTGKARVKLGKMANAQAYTIAQFLTKQGRFDWERMKIKFVGTEKYKAEQNVIIDECSMLTEEDFYGIFQALDLAHIKRIILVGDPYQLPPIGAGRPFADLCNYIESLENEDENIDAKLSLARLKEVVRTVEGENSDCLTLASWYSGLKPSKNADSIFSKLGDNSNMNDLQVENWQNEEELYKKINQTLIEVLNLKNESDAFSLNSFLGIDGDKIDTSKIESFQILTPVKSPYWGTFNLNQIIQNQFRKDLKDAVKIGDYKIGKFDKIIQTKNESKDAYPGNQKWQISNGQLGIVKSTIKGNANVAFAGVDDAVTFGYKSQGQTETDESNIELAYSITIHKSQGSDFDYVFLIVPKTGRIISRELIYTALTRAKRKLILLIEGDNPHWIINLSKPQHSETSKRNTQIFSPSIREAKSHIPYVEGLIHKTKKDGLLVRSKSEVIISNELEYRGLSFEYEREFIGVNGQKRIPDFTFIDAAGDIIILEHLGMLGIPSYKEDWEKKKKFYEESGFKINENLFVTTESEKGGIDSKEIERVIDKVEKLL